MHLRHIIAHILSCERIFSLNRLFNWSMPLNRTPFTGTFAPVAMLSYVNHVLSRIGHLYKSLQIFCHWKCALNRLGERRGRHLKRLFKIDLFTLMHMQSEKGRVAMMRRMETPASSRAQQPGPSGSAARKRKQPLILPKFSHRWRSSPAPQGPLAILH